MFVKFMMMTTLMTASLALMEPKLIPSHLATINGILRKNVSSVTVVEHRDSYRYLPSIVEPVVSTEWLTTNDKVIEVKSNRTLRIDFTKDGLMLLGHHTEKTYKIIQVQKVETHKFGKKASKKRYVFHMITDDEKADNWNKFEICMKKGTTLRELKIVNQLASKMNDIVLLQRHRENQKKQEKEAQEAKDHKEAAEFAASFQAKCDAEKAAAEAELDAAKAAAVQKETQVNHDSSSLDSDSERLIEKSATVESESESNDVNDQTTGLSGNDWCRFTRLNELSVLHVLL